ncbi:hypothetical protein GCM10022207_61700 [Streptomyces lannensis]|uniref:Uncharacterized protein n=2 Tax=Streptomyces lannensis TaxID=766498 RepID=A0ABP7KRE9_9ACTN
MTDHQQAPSADDDRRDRPLTLSVLRQLVRKDWSKLPGDTLVVLSADTEGNRFSPFSTYGRSRYAPLSPDDQVGETYPLPEELKRDKELRELYPEIPATAVPALVLYPLG